MQINQLITYQAFSAEKIPFENDHFDAVFLFGCLHHMKEDIRVTAIQECISISKSTGSICVFEPNKIDLEIIRRIDPEHPDAADPVRYSHEFNLSVKAKEGDFFTAFILNTLILHKIS